MNDLRIQSKPFDFNQAVARAGLRPDGLPIGTASSSVSATPALAEGGGSFATAMASALQSVSASQMQAGKLQRELTLDNPAVSLEETMVAMQKAQIGFQATLAVRNRLVNAYSEIMNMQV